MPNRKLGRPSDQRRAILRNLSTALIMHGRVVTTEARAKEIRPIVEKIISLAVREYKNSETVTKKRIVTDKKNQRVEQEVQVIRDLPSKLHARRMIMAYLYDVPIPKLEGESKSEYKARTKDRRHPVIEKLFRDIAPRYEGRNGGYTRIAKLGPRRGDAAEMAVIELV
ncbi:MAG TPA: 50S ribosomal protein L17 [Clostridiales bacterium]|jgi:large subunit ribosomal protein L17|nr:50S ribosomal protein L17 [Clostridiales bacterium]